MNDARRTKAELIAELQALRHEVAALRALVGEQRQTPGDEPCSSSLLDHSADEVVTILDRHGTIRYISPTVRSILGYHPQGITGVNFFAAVHPDDFTRAQQVFTELLAAAGTSVSIELRRLHVDGRWRIMALRLTNLLNDPRVQGIVARAHDVTEQRHREVERQKAERLYQAVFDVLSAGIVVYRAGGEIVACNAAAERILGLSREQLLGRTAFDSRWRTIHEDGSAFSEETHPAVVTLNSGQPQRDVVMGVHKPTGELVWININSQALCHVGEAVPYAAVVSFIDITAQKQALELLRSSQQQYQTLVDSIDGIVWEVDAATLQFTFVSPQAERLLGYPVAQWLTEPDFWPNHIYPEDRDWAISFCLSQTKEKRAHHFTYRMLTADGRVIWIQDVVSVIVENQQPVKLRGVMIDITSQKQTELLLQAERDFARQIMDAMGQGLVVINADGRVEYVNPALSRLVGYQPEEVVGKPALQFVPPERHPLALQRFERLQQGEALAYEANVRRADGQVVPVLCNGVARRNGEKISGSIWVLTDMTPWKQAEAEKHKLQQQLFHAQKLESVGVLAGGVAHDFNNLLLVMMGNMELALDDLPANARGRGRVQEALEAGRRAAQLVRQLLMFSRPQDSLRQVVRLHAVIRDTLQLLRVALPETICVRCVVPSSGGSCNLCITCNETPVCCSLDTWADTVWGDPAQLQQVLMNLCLNALDAMEDTGGVLEIRLQRVVIGHNAEPALMHLQPGPYVCLSVRDTGCGMSAEIKERIFDPFFTTKPVGKGSGLGLAVVCGIVRAHGGGLAVESQPGAGTTISVYLPVLAEDTSAPKHEGVSCETDSPH